MIIEDLSLPQALKRATYIVKNNLLLVAVTEVGVGTVVGLAGFLLGLLAVALGVVVFLALASISLAAAIVAAVLVAGLPLALITAFTSYVTTAYHTCLFLWAREAEKAVSQGQSAQTARAPAPLAAVLAQACIRPAVAPYEQHAPPPPSRRRSFESRFDACDKSCSSGAMLTI